MEVIQGGEKSPNKLQSRRKGLLAIVHIAKKKLGLDDEMYRACLKYYGSTTAAALSVPELEDLVDYFESLGFKRKVSGVRGQVSGRRRIADALHARILEEAGDLENGEARVAGLVKKICHVDDLRFCLNSKKLKQILKIVCVMKEDEPGNRGTGEPGKRRGK